MAKIYISPIRYAEGSHIMCDTTAEVYCQRVAELVRELLASAGHEIRVAAHADTNSDRIAAAVEMAADYYLSIVVSSNANNTGYPSVIACGRPTGKSWAACGIIQRKLNDAVPWADGAVRATKWIREVVDTPMLSAYVILGNINNATESRWLADNAEAVAGELARGVNEWFSAPAAAEAADDIDPLTLDLIGRRLTAVYGESAAADIMEALRD